MFSAPTFSLSALSALLGNVPASQSFSTGRVVRLARSGICRPAGLCSPPRGHNSCLGPWVDSPIFAFWPLRLAQGSMKRALRDESPRRRPHPSAEVPAVPQIGDRTPRLPPAPPQPHSPGSAARSPGPHGATASPARALEAPGASLPGWTPQSMLSAPPGTRLSRGRDQFSVFSRWPRGRRGGEAGRQSAPCSVPPPWRPAAAARAARCGPIRSRGWGLGRHALPLGLLRVISRNSVQREEREEREKERGAEGRRDRGSASKTGRSAPESLKQEREQEFFWVLSPQRAAGESPSPQL